MHFDYLTDHTEKTLTPWASPVIWTKLFYQGLIGALCLIFIFWPRQELQEFIRLQEIPLSFFGLCAVSLLMNAYLNLRCGLGEFTPIKEMPWIEYQKHSTYEEERPFIFYGLPGFMLHTVLLLLPLLPLIFIAAGLSVVPAGVLVQALVMLLLLSLLCRLFGFWIYLQAGRKGAAAYFATRIFFVLLFLPTLLAKEKSSPLVMLYALNKGELPMIRPGLSAFNLQLLVAALLALMLIGMIRRAIAVRRRKGQESKA